MLYSSGSGGFYDRAIHADIPVDAVEVTAEEYGALLQGQSEGRRIVADVDGRPVLQAPPAPTHADLVDRALREVRVERQPILNVLDGLQVSAIVASDAALASDIELAKQALRDITTLDLSACVTYADMRLAFLGRYAELVAAAPASVKPAFDGAIA